MEPKLHHVAISVPNLEESVAWYTEMLGLREIMRAGIPGTETRIAFVGNDDFQVEIFQVAGAKPLPKGRSMPNEDNATHGVKHLCLMVENARDYVAGLEARGVKKVFEPEGMPSYAAFVVDNAGNLIEFFDVADH